MKKHIGLFAGLLMTMVLSFGTMGLISREVKEIPKTVETAVLEEQKEEQNPVAPEEKETLAEEGGFLLKEYYGNIGVFSAGKSEPLYVTEISMDSLRAYDRESLKTGIRLREYEEVLQLLEDFNS